MKQNVLLVLAIFCSFALYAQDKQETENESKFGMRFKAKLGFATLVQSDMVDLHGSANGGDILFYYNLPGGASVSTGIGDLQFQANGISAGEGYSLNQRYLRIPLYFNYSMAIFDEQLDKKLQAYAGFGLYASTLLKEKIQTLEGTYKNKNQGWNGGLGFEIGLNFEVSNDFIFGIGFESQSDFSKLKKNDIKRKLEGISTVNFTLGFKF